MIQLMMMENASQRGNASSAALLNEIAAVTRRMANLLLSGDDLAPFGARCPHFAVAFESQKSFEVARGQLEHGDAVGRRIIMRYFGEGDEKKCPRSECEINSAKRQHIYSTKIGIFLQDI